MLGQKGDASPPPTRSKVSPPPAATVVEQPQEKPSLEAKKESLAEEKPPVPVQKPSSPARKPFLPPKQPIPPSEKPSPPFAKLPPPEEKPAIPPERPKPAFQPEVAVTPSPSAPVERPKAAVERPEPVAKAEGEASLKGPEQKPASLLGDLISQGPQLLSENRQLKILEQVQKLTPEERQNINVKVLECFAHLKRVVVDKDRQSKPFWNQLYESLERSNNRNATPLLVRITKDPEEYTRLYAVTLLGSIGDHRAIGDLQQIASSDPNRKIRRSAAKSVALIQKRG
jgi:hypothetical protein